MTGGLRAGEIAQQVFDPVQAVQESYIRWPSQQRGCILLRREVV